MLIAAMILKDACSCDKTRHVLKNRDIALPTNAYIFKDIGFPVIIYGRERHKEGSALKN